jgi:hypothetical protein
VFMMNEFVCHHHHWPTHIAADILQKNPVHFRPFQLWFPLCSCPFYFPLNFDTENLLFPHKIAYLFFVLKLFHNILAVCVSPVVSRRLCLGRLCLGRLCLGRLCLAGCVFSQKGTFVSEIGFFKIFDI